MTGVVSGLERRLTGNVFYLKIGSDGDWRIWSWIWNSRFRQRRL